MKSERKKGYVRIHDSSKSRSKQNTSYRCGENVLKWNKLHLLLPLNTSIQLDQHNLALALHVCGYDIKHNKWCLRNLEGLVMCVEVYYKKKKTCLPIFSHKPIKHSSPLFITIVVHLHIWLSLFIQSNKSNVLSLGIKPLTLDLLVPWFTRWPAIQYVI